MRRWVANFILGATAALFAPLATTQADQPVSFQSLLANTAGPATAGAAAQTALVAAVPARAMPVSNGAAPGARNAGLYDDSESRLASAAPDPTVAWLMAFGFLAVIIYRRAG